MNIGGDPADLSYRYKRPKIIAHFEHNETVIDNIAGLSRALETPPLYIIKFFGYELGTRSDRNRLRGRHNLDVLESLIEKYIKLFIICPKCLLPECDIVKHAVMLCRACGNSVVCRDHKITTYMFAHPFY